ASGARVLRHGYTRDHVAGLRVILNTGDARTVGREPRPPLGSEESGTDRLHEIVLQVTALLEQNRELIHTCGPRTRFNRCGYLLHDVLTAEHLDLARLLVGSEGTLALFTEATLRTVPLPGGQSLVLLSFDNLETALRAAQLALPSGPTSCDLLDRRLLTLVRGRATALAPP